MLKELSEVYKPVVMKLMNYGMSEPIAEHLVVEVLDIYEANHPKPEVTVRMITDARVEELMMMLEESIRVHNRSAYKASASEERSTHMYVVGRLKDILGDIAEYNMSYCNALDLVKHELNDEIYHKGHDIPDIFRFAHAFCASALCDILEGLGEGYEEDQNCAR